MISCVFIISDEKGMSRQIENFISQIDGISAVQFHNFAKTARLGRGTSRSAYSKRHALDSRKSFNNSKIILI